MRKDVKRRKIPTSKAISLIKPSYHGIEMERVLRDLRSAQKGLVKMTARIKNGELKVIPKEHTDDLMIATDGLERFLNQLEWIRVDEVSEEEGEENVT